MIGTNFVPDVDFLERILGTADVLTEQGREPLSGHLALDMAGQHEPAQGRHLPQALTELRGCGHAVCHACQPVQLRLPAKWHASTPPSSPRRKV